MFRKIITIGVIVMAMVAVLLSEAAFAQSTSGRSQGCFDSSGNHHNPGWCAKHGH
jgi:hypothetical protein